MSVSASCGRPTKKRPFSPAEWVGIAALLFSPLFWMVDPCLAMVPPAGFLLLCFVMPFFPGSTFFLPVKSRGKTGQPVVGLTFDDGPDPVSTPSLLRLLEKYGAIATFFVTGERLRRYPDIGREIISRGHSIGNHSYTHDDYLMFRGTKTIIREIESTQEACSKLGFLPRLFRPPVGITTPRYAPAIHQTGLQVVNFSIRARDMGNRRVRGLCGRILAKLCADDIILLHDIPPRGGVDLQAWLDEVECLLAGIKDKGLAIVPLEVLIDQPVISSADELPVMDGF